MFLSNKGYQKVIRASWIIRVTLGLLFILVGLDKFFNILVEWQKFIGPLSYSFIPLSPSLLLGLFGAYQIVLGLWLLVRGSLASAYTVLITLLIIFFNLIGTANWQLIIMHDVIMIVLAVVLILLTKIKNMISFAP